MHAVHAEIACGKIHRILLDHEGRSISTTALRWTQEIRWPHFLSHGLAFGVSWESNSGQRDMAQLSQIR